MSDLITSKSLDKTKAISKEYKNKPKDKTKPHKQQIDKKERQQTDKRHSLLDQITFQSFSQEYYDQTVDLLTDIFVNEEPICKTTCIASTDLRQFVEQTIAISSNLSSLAILNYKDEEGNICSKVISALISCDQSELIKFEEKYESIKAPQIQFILNLFKITQSKLNELIGINLNVVNKGEIIHQVLLGTHKNYQGMGIGFYLALHNAQVIKKNGFQKVVMELTSNASLKICKIFNIGKIIYSVKYAELKENEFKEFFQSIEDRLLEEQISIYLIDTSDFKIEAYEQQIKNLKLIFQ